MLVSSRRFWWHAHAHAPPTHAPTLTPLPTLDSCRASLSALVHPNPDPGVGTADAAAVPLLKKWVPEHLRPREAAPVARDHVRRAVICAVATIGGGVARGVR